MGVIRTSRRKIRYIWVCVSAVRILYSGELMFCFVFCSWDYYGKKHSLENVLPLTFNNSSRLSFTKDNVETFCD